MTTLRQIEENLIYRLRKRADIRRQIPTRKSVQEGEPDRIADLLDEAADVIESLETALAEQEPVAWQWCRSGHFRKKIPKTAYPEDWRPLYITPPQKQWLGLTDEDIAMATVVKYADVGYADYEYKEFARAIEARLKEKNT